MVRRNRADSSGRPLAHNEGFDEALDQGEGRAQLMADVRDEFLAGVLELLEPRQIMKDEDRPALRSGPIKHRGGVDLKPAFWTPASSSSWPCTMRSPASGG